MAAAEDCASVLEQFIHDAANLPAEISHMMEEIQAKDNELQKYQSSISGKDGNIQKHIKLNGVLQAHPKEGEYAEQVKKNFELSSDLQKQKVQLSEKACALLDRQIKKLDTKIRELQSDGQLIDGPPLPSIFNRKAEPPKSFIDIPTNVPLQPANLSALNRDAHRMNSQVVASIHQPQARPQLTALNTAPQRSSAPATPAAVLQHQQRQREVSQGAENRKRKLGSALGGVNLPAQPSNLRQSSLGPGTPKAGTPTVTTGSRAGSVPRASAAPQSATTMAPKKNTPLQKQVALSKMKKKGTKNVNMGGRRKGQSPSVRSGRGGTAASEGDDSVLSSADASETDASQSRRGGRKKKVKEEPEVEMVEDEEHEDEDADDDTRYCFCQQQSYGEMVACENDDCKYQWFHTGCINMKKVPEEDEDWYCPDCRIKPEIIEKMRIKFVKKSDKAGRK